MAHSDETRDLVKRLVTERLVEKVGVRNIVYHGEEINVIRDGDSLLLLNLPRLKKSYAVMSGRVYEREYVDDGGKVVDVSEPQASPMTQLNYKGEPEEVDTAIFRNKLICSCGGVRYVKNADLFQVTKCKPCTIRGRNKRRQKRGA
jgi:hypothetical protein